MAHYAYEYAINCLQITHILHVSKCLTIVITIHHHHHSNHHDHDFNTMFKSQVNFCSLFNKQIIVHITVLGFLTFVSMKLIKCYLYTFIGSTQYFSYIFVIWKEDFLNFKTGSLSNLLKYITEVRYSLSLLLLFYFALYITYIGYSMRYLLKHFML